MALAYAFWYCNRWISFQGRRAWFLWRFFRISVKEDGRGQECCYRCQRRKACIWCLQLIYTESLWPDYSGCMYQWQCRNIYSICRLCVRNEWCYTSRTSGYSYAQQHSGTCISCTCYQGRLYCNAWLVFNTECISCCY